MERREKELKAIIETNRQIIAEQANACEQIITVEKIVPQIIKKVVKKEIIKEIQVLDEVQAEAIR